MVEPLRALGLNVLGGWAQRAEARSGAHALAADPRLRARGEKKTAWPCGYGTVVVSERVWRNAADEWQRPFAAAAPSAPA